MKPTTQAPMKEPELKPIASTPELKPSEKPAEKPEATTATIVAAAIQKPHLSDIYASIDLAPKDWLPSILARVARRADNEKIWLNADALLNAVKTVLTKKT